MAQIIIEGLTDYKDTPELNTHLRLEALLTLVDSLEDELGLNALHVYKLVESSLERTRGEDDCNLLSYEDLMICSDTSKTIKKKIRGKKTRADTLATWLR